MSKLHADQVFHDGAELDDVLDNLEVAAAEEYEHPATHDVSMITGARSSAEITAEIAQAIADLTASAPATLDTLNEIAQALGDDPNLSTTLTNLIATKSEMYIVADTFASGTTQLVINDARIVEATCKVEVVPEVEKQGDWTLSYVDGVATIDSDTTETVDVPVTLYIIKAGA